MTAIGVYVSFELFEQIWQIIQGALAGVSRLATERVGIACLDHRTDATVDRARCAAIQRRLQLNIVQRNKGGLCKRSGHL
jgi:hypothetical protein